MPMEDKYKWIKVENLPEVRNGGKGTNVTLICGGTNRGRQPIPKSTSGDIQSANSNNSMHAVVWCRPVPQILVCSSTTCGVPHKLEST